MEVSIIGGPLFVVDDQFFRTEVEQFSGKCPSELLCVIGRTDDARTEHVRSVVRGRTPAYGQFLEDTTVVVERLDDLCERTDRRGAPRFQLGEQCTLRDNCRATCRIVEFREYLDQGGVLGTALDCERAWDGAGSICTGSSASVTRSSRPIRDSPARAMTIASSSPESTLPMRVSMLPRSGSSCKPSPSAASCARRRGADVRPSIRRAARRVPARRERREHRVDPHGEEQPR